MKSYPHMCRDEHVEIGHADNSSELCPLCRANGRIKSLEAQLAQANEKLAALQWRPITAEDLPERGDELFAIYDKGPCTMEVPDEAGALIDCTHVTRYGLFLSLDGGMDLHDLQFCGWTHFRPISAPPPSEKGKP